MRGLLGALLLVGYTFAAATVQIYDDADTTGGHVAGPHSLAEMAASTNASVAAAVLDSGYNFKAYRILQNVRLGSNTGGQTNTTTWTDTDAVIDFDATKTLSFGTAASNASNVTLNWGTKIGSGNKATGRNGVVAYLAGNTTMRGNWSLYGCTIIQTPTAGAAFSWTPATGGGDIIDCIIGHRGTGSTAQIAWGSAVQAINNCYNVDFWGNSSATTGSVLSTFNCTNAERITIGGNAFFAGIRSSQSAISVKDFLFFGTPGTADIINIGGAASGWALVRPGWSGNAAKFGNMTTAAGLIQEYWLYDVIVTDATGSALSVVPVKLTDTLGNVVVNTTTDSGGRITFGSGITLNAVSVMDHYGTASNYLTRARSPFLAEVNTGTSANTNYPSRRYYFNWPTETNGNFKDCTDVVSLAFAGGNPSSWVERIVPS